MARRAPAHAGSAQDQARIMRRILGRAEARQRDPRLDPVDRDVLNVLDRLVVLGYGDGRIGVRKLAELVHRTDRTVRRHLARLECLGYLEVGEREHGHGGPACNRYRVLSPRERGAQAWAARRKARAERDQARKRPRGRRRGGGVLTRTAPAHTRGRVNARSGTGEDGRQRPTVPVGQASKQEASMVERAHGPASGAGQGQPGRGGPGAWRLPDEAAIVSLRPVPYSETDAGRREVADAQARVAALVARAQRRGADRDDNGPVAA